MVCRLPPGSHQGACSSMQHLPGSAHVLHFAGVCRGWHGAPPGASPARSCGRRWWRSPRPRGAPRASGHRCVPARCVPRWPMHSTLRTRSGTAPGWVRWRNMASNVARMAPRPPPGHHQDARRRSSSSSAQQAMSLSMSAPFAAPRRTTLPLHRECRLRCSSLQFGFGHVARSKGPLILPWFDHPPALSHWRTVVWTSPCAACQTSPGDATWMPSGAYCSAASRNSATRRARTGCSLGGTMY
jgi:hypothetical protein